MENWKEGDIVQIINEKHHWFPCLIIVSEPKSWGIQGYLSIPHDNKGNVGNAYIRLNDDEIVIVGKAAIVAK
jgi:hypothetical protein